MKFIEEGVSISKLNLSSNAIKDKGVQLLSQLLKSNSDLVHLDISSNDITPHGFAILFESLKENNTIVSLNISSSEHWFKNKIGVEGCKALKELLKENIFIQLLNLSSVCLGDEGLHILTKGILFKYNSQMNLMSLQDKKSSQTSSFYSRNIQSISSLIIKSNELTPNSMESICKILSSNIILLLDLSGNKVFNPVSMKYFSRSLSNESMSLKILKLK